jgi:DNA polymerase-3 subunit gamma/tau
MEYEVTATRKRPRTFDGLVGQEFVVASLTNSLKSGRIAHAYLFSGPRGVGKTSAARILARALNCPEGYSIDDDFPGSEEIARGTAIDVIEIDGASNTSVNDVRQIKDEVLFAPTSAKYKIYIIDEVHMLSNSAFNALLKTIEEPPPYIVFIFATTEIHKVPATIRSRCQQFNFRLIPVDLIVKMLTEVAGEVSVTADEDALFWIAKEASGSLRDAYTLFDQIVSFAEGHISLERIKETLGIVGLDDLNEIADAIADGDGQQLVELTDRVLSEGVSIEQLVVDLAGYFRSLLFIRKGIHKEALLGFSRDRFSAKIVRVLSDSQIERALELLLELYRAIRYSLNQRFDLDLTMSKMAALRDFLTPAEILGEVTELRDLITGESGDATKNAVYDKAAPGDRGAGSDQSRSGSERQEGSSGAASRDAGITSEQVNAIVTRVKSTKLALSTALEKAVVWQMSESELTIEFDSEYPASHARGEEELIRTAAIEVLGRPVLVRITVATDETADPEDHSGTAGDDSAQPDVQDSKVDMVRRVFRGEVVDG